MNMTVSQDNLYLLLPSKMSWLANMLAEDKGISIVKAIKTLYSSAFYARLADESTNCGILVLWPYMRNSSPSIVPKTKTVHKSV